LTVDKPDQIYAYAFIERKEHTIFSAEPTTTRRMGFITWKCMPSPVIEPTSCGNHTEEVFKDRNCEKVILCGGIFDWDYGAIQSSLIWALWIWPEIDGVFPISWNSV
jgi:hypothetical protein